MIRRSDIAELGLGIMKWDGVLRSSVGLGIIESLGMPLPDMRAPKDAWLYKLSEKDKVFFGTLLISCRHERSEACLILCSAMFG